MTSRRSQTRCSLSITQAPETSKCSYFWLVEVLPKVVLHMPQGGFPFADFVITPREDHSCSRISGYMLRVIGLPRGGSFIFLCPGCRHVMLILRGVVLYHALRGWSSLNDLRTNSCATLVTSMYSFTSRCCHLKCTFLKARLLPSEVYGLPCEVCCPDL